MDLLSLTLPEIKDEDETSVDDSDNDFMTCNRSGRAASRQSYRRRDSSSEDSWKPNEGDQSSDESDSKDGEFQLRAHQRQAAKKEQEQYRRPSARSDSRNRAAPRQRSRSSLGAISIQQDTSQGSSKRARSTTPSSVQQESSQGSTRRGRSFTSISARQAPSQERSKRTRSNPPRTTRQSSSRATSRGRSASRPESAASRSRNQSVGPVSSKPRNARQVRAHSIEPGRSHSAQPPDSPTLKFLQTLRKFKRGERKCLNLFLAKEKTEFKNRSEDVKIWPNGIGHRGKIGKLTNVHLFKSIQGLGMEVPDDIDFSTVLKYIFAYHNIHFAYSDTGKMDSMSTMKLLDKFAAKRNENSPIINSITHQFDGDWLNDVFKLPFYVDEVSMVHKLVKALEAVKQELDEVIEAKEEDIIAFKEDFQGTRRKFDEIIKTKRDEVKADRKNRENVEKRIKDMPKYERFFFLSMKDSFTEVHIDFSETSVYNYVPKGQKIFYLVPYTEENFRLFKEHELDSSDPRWIAELFADQWQRVVISEGELLFIPGGYIHFVYTSVDTIMIGANFLTEDDLERQIKITRFDEEKQAQKRSKSQRKNESHMFQGFWNVMWAYIEYCLIPELRDSRVEATTTRLLGLADVFLLNLDVTQRIQTDWYSKVKKMEIYRDLQEAARLHRVPAQRIRTPARRTIKTEVLDQPSGGPAPKRVKSEIKSEAPEKPSGAPAPKRVKFEAPDSNEASTSQGRAIKTIKVEVEDEDEPSTSWEPIGKRLRGNKTIKEEIMSDDE